ncbi:hypothetical protein [Rhizobium laguerreae]|uniref:hypothetical protein n=1 Tax=Rhizobium laguerreae TaxID=1076926 RepID=UPI001FF0040B|nr:hypothetical protein [Rhizobium laguerreae]
MTKILAAALSISLCIMIDASIAVASDAKETLQIPKIFSAVKLRDCNQYDSKERRACEATTLRLGYFSWGLCSQLEASI